MADGQSEKLFVADRTIKEWNATKVYRRTQLERSFLCTSSLRLSSCPTSSTSSHAVKVLEQRAKPALQLNCYCTNRSQVLYTYIFPIGIYIHTYIHTQYKLIYDCIVYYKMYGVHYLESSYVMPGFLRLFS